MAVNLFLAGIHSLVLDAEEILSGVYRVGLGFLNVLSRAVDIFPIRESARDFIWAVGRRCTMESFN